MATETAPDTVEQGPGEMFGPYRLEGTIGRGGMGEVFRAYDTGRERTVALKRLRPALAQDAEYQDRFRRESRVAARLSSPHVVPIHDFGEIDGSLFIDMRLVGGHDLGAEIARGGRLEPARAADVVRQVADAVLERGLAKDPEQRWASAGDLADAAVEALGSGAVVPTQRTASDAAGPTAARAAVVAGPGMPPGPGGPGWGPPPAGYGPPAGLGPSTPYPGPPPRRRTPTAVWVVVAVIATVLVLVGGLVVAGLALGGDPAPAAGPTDPGTAAPAAGSPRPDDASGRTIRAAFGDIAARSCQAYAPQDGEYVTSSGVRPLALYRCAYADAAPNGYVYYAQWPDQASADRYQADQVSTGPSTDGTDTWGPGRDTWGRMHTRQAQGYLYATGGYDTRPFTFDIAVTTIAERDAILRTMSLLPAAQLPVG